MLRSALIVLAFTQTFTNANDPNLDRTAPTVTISAPTSSSTFDAGVASTVTLAGTSADANGTAICRATNAATGTTMNATTAGDGSWSIVVAINVGSNAITVTCLDPGNNAGTDIITVTSTTSSTFTCPGLRCFFLKDDCTVDGNGLAESGAGSGGCAASAGASGPRNDPQVAFNMATTPGDWVVARANTNGTLIHCSQGFDDDASGGCQFTNSGTEANPIGLTNYPNEVPTFTNCDTNNATTIASMTYSDCNNGTIGYTGEHDVIIASYSCAISPSTCTYNGLSTVFVVGAITPSGPEGVDDGNGAHRNHIRGVHIEIGFAEASPPEGDGNWSAIYAGDQDSFEWQHNYIANIAMMTGAVNGSSAAFFKCYRCSDGLIEKNTGENLCLSCGGFQNAGGMIEDKERPQRNVWRYNMLLNGGRCFRGNNQGDIFTRGGDDVRVYGNVCTIAAGSTNSAFAFPNGDNHPYPLQQNSWVYNNTVYNASGSPDAGVFTMNVIGNPGNRFYNNALNIRPSNGFGIINYGTAAEIDGYIIDYNAYTPNRGFRYRGTVYANLAALVAGTAQEDHGVNADCTFVNAAANDFRLSGGACVGAGRVDPTNPLSTAVDIGAYGVTSCVGNTCP